jgi:hypothetical protein
VRFQANAPGWVTINYAHSGTGGAIGFYIEREGAGTVFASVAPSGQLIDTHLEPDTQYAYRACAAYEGADEPACSNFFPARTLPANNKPANFDPPLINDVTIDIGKIAITWGPTGDCSKVLLRLDDDGQSFAGSWSASTDPNMISGTWSGTRAGSGAQPATPSTGLGAKKNKGPKLIPN